jgi:hypothetical protein
MKNANLHERSDNALPAMSESNPARILDVQGVSHSDRAHSKISPSKLKQLEICPGFLSDDTGEVHVITLAGTRCHLALETGDDSALSSDELRLVNMCRGYRDAMMPGHIAITEQKLKVTDDMFGYADLILLPKSTCAI